MASENREIIDNYVNPESLRDDFAWLATISEEERDAAARAITITRAQFVVDVALKERDDRLITMWEKVDAAYRDADVLRDETNALHEAIGFPPLGRPVTEPAQELDPRRRLLTLKGSELWTALANETPFEVTMKSTDGNLTSWQQSRIQQIAERYGETNKNVFGRVAYGITRFFWNSDTHAGNGWELTVQGPEVANLKVLDARALRDAIKDGKPGCGRLVVGEKSMAALACIAEMQREEREAATQSVE